MPEKIELKRKVLVQLDEAAPEDTIVASNSSSYPISELIEGLSLKKERRVLSAHSCEFLGVHTEMTCTDNGQTGRQRRQVRGRVDMLGSG